ncbi:hypothetical protein [Streptomyces sp. NPDC003006]
MSRKLEAALAGAGQCPAQWGEPAWSAERIYPVRIDLARSAGTSFEDVILTIRAALAELGHALPAFDIALRRYWEIQHPGESLEEYLRRGGLGARFGKAMPQQMQSALADIAQALLLPGTVGTAVGAVIGSLTGRCASGARPYGRSPDARGWWTSWRPRRTWKPRPSIPICWRGSSPGSRRTSASCR